MMHGSEWILKYDESDVKNFQLRVIIFHATRMTMLHLFCRMANR